MNRLKLGLYTGVNSSPTKHKMSDEKKKIQIKYELFNHMSWLFYKKA